MSNQILEQGKFLAQTAEMALLTVQKQRSLDSKIQALELKNQQMASEIASLNARLGLLSASCERKH